MRVTLRYMRFISATPSRVLTYLRVQISRLCNHNFQGTLASLSKHRAQFLLALFETISQVLPSVPEFRARKVYTLRSIERNTEAKHRRLEFREIPRPGILAKLSDLSRFFVLLGRQKLTRSLPKSTLTDSVTCALNHRGSRKSIYIHVYPPRRAKFTMYDLILNEKSLI